MKVQVSKLLKDFDGESVKIQDRDLFLKDVLIKALSMPEQKMDYNEMLKRYLLAQKIQDASDEIELKSEDIVLLKKQIGNAGYSPMIGGQAINELEKPKDG